MLQAFELFDLRLNDKLVKPDKLWDVRAHDKVMREVCIYMVCHAFTSSSCSLREKSSLPIFYKTLSVVSPVTGWKRTSYIRVFFIENFLMAKIFQPSDKITLIFILFYPQTCMIKARPKYPMDLHGTIYIDNIQKAVVICLIISTTFPFDSGSSVDNVHHTSGYFFMLDPASIKRKYCQND